MVTFTFKCGKEEKEKIQREAQLVGESASKYVRKSITMRSVFGRIHKSPEILDRLLRITETDEDGNENCS